MVSCNKEQLAIFSLMPIKQIVRSVTQYGQDHGGPEGSGKTKRLVELVTKAVEEEQGDVICIEKDKNLTYDIPYQARLIHASDYNIGTFEFMKGFISGLRAGNYDISHIFIDNFHKMFNSTPRTR